MLIKHKFDKTGKAHTIGMQAQNDFPSYMQKKGFEVTKSTIGQDMVEHWDFKITKGEESYRVDVKAEKRVSRSDENTQSDLIWIEFQNGAGEVGWLYGKADLIAFQHGDEYLFVDRLKLVERVESLVRAEYVKSPQQALYRLYRRWNREDLLTMIRLSDINDITISL